MEYCIDYEKYITSDIFKTLANGSIIFRLVFSFKNVSICYLDLTIYAHINICLLIQNSHDILKFLL